MSDKSANQVELKVDYIGGSPTEISYFHTVFGMMKFEVEDSAAILDGEWDRLSDRDLKDGFTRWVTTGDVIRSVQNLPFIDSVEVPNHV